MSDGSLQIRISLIFFSSSLVQCTHVVIGLSSTWARVWDTTKGQSLQGESHREIGVVLVLFVSDECYFRLDMAEARATGVIRCMLNGTDQSFRIMRQGLEIVRIIEKVTKYNIFSTRLILGK